MLQRWGSSAVGCLDCLFEAAKDYEGARVPETELRASRGAGTEDLMRITRREASAWDTTVNFRVLRSAPARG